MAMLQKKALMSGYRLFLILLLGLSVFLSCDKAAKEESAEVLWSRGTENFFEEDYTEAREDFEALTNLYPYNENVNMATLYIADCFFFERLYDEAIAVYQEFRKLYPGHEEIPYAIYQTGVAYFKQKQAIDRDQGPTWNAKKEFELLINYYPNNLYIYDAKDKFAVCEEQLAQHEFYVAKFYFRTGHHEAALYRLKTLLEQYPEVKNSDEALLLLGRSYLALEQQENAEETFRYLLKKFPESRPASKAHQYIPRE